MNKELTFTTLLQTIRHEMGKGAEQRALLIPAIAPFTDYCRLCGNPGVLRMLKELQSILITGSVEEIARQCSALEGEVISRRLTGTAPGVKSHEVLLYKRSGCQRIGLLFTHQAIKFAMAALLKSLFCYKTIARKYLVRDLQDSDIVICDGAYGAMLQATAIHYKKCIIMDTKQPDENKNEIFISLPLTINGFKTICDELLHDK
jgi:hypothetical protein